MPTLFKKLPLYYLLTVALVGLLMRLTSYLDLGFEFTNVRHAHSHLAFLGWVYSAFYVLIWQSFLNKSAYQKYLTRLFWLTQVSVIGMFIGFWFVGYQPVSIAFLTIHTGLAYAFIVYALRRVDCSPMTRFLLKWAFAFFFISSLGPFAIPVIKVMGKEEFMTAAVNFYLHFHYNGWFIFGVFALLSHFIHLSKLKSVFTILIVTTFLAYFELLYLYQVPSLLLLLTNVAVVLQWLVTLYLVYHFIKNSTFVFSVILKKIFDGIIIILGIKYTAQMIGILPFAWVGFEFFTHFNIVGYLHLLFLGVVTPMILVIYIKLDWLRISVISWITYALGWLLTEVGLFLVGSSSLDTGILHQLVLVGSLFLIVGILGFVLNAKMQRFVSS